MRVTRLTAIAVLVILACGCTGRTGKPAAPEAGEVSPPELRPVELKEFGHGRAVIRIGMTREEVLSQIAVSGLPEWNGQFGIRRPPAEMMPTDRWQLTYGCTSGAAPGGGVVIVEFCDGKVVRLLIPRGPAFARQPKRRAGVISAGSPLRADPL